MDLMMETDYANSTLTFPQKLFILMEREIGDIVHWVGHGLCFRITDQDIFANDIAPKYFKHTKLTSFQRQLNLYGFRRLTKGEDQGCYFHPSFQRDRKDLLHKIKRLPVKGSLSNYDQVLQAAGRSPSERFGSTMNDSTYSSRMGTRSASQSSPLLSANATAASTQVASNYTSSNVNYTSSSGTSSQVYVPRTLSKVTLNIGFGRTFNPQLPYVQAPAPAAAVIEQSTGSQQQTSFYTMNSQLAPPKLVASSSGALDALNPCNIPEDFDFLELLNSSGALYGLTPPLSQATDAQCLQQQVLVSMSSTCSAPDPHPSAHRDEGRDEAKSGGY